MFFLDEAPVTSASDLTTASKCEFAFLRGIDVKLGRVPAVAAAEDPMLVRTSRLGDEHEARVLQEYRDRFGTGVVEIARPESMSLDDLTEAARVTREAFAGGADVVFQATFFDGEFLGFADFIVRQPDGSYQVQDTKLARSARVTALLQLAAYAAGLESWGVRVAPEVVLILGDRSTSIHRLSAISPVYRNRRERLLSLVTDRVGGEDAVAWGDPAFTVCGHCDACAEQIEATRDVLLVAGLRVTQRERLRGAGIRTIDELAASIGPVDGISAGTLDNLRVQAQLQVSAAHGSNDAPPYRVAVSGALAVIPLPNAGDIFFDFEGDPLYTEGPGERWGLDYLFGFVDERDEFTAIWAHTFAEERVALRAFLDDVAERRRAHPDLHIYHYAPYEKTHLLSIAARYGEGEDEVDQLLRENVLVDLYPIVRKALRVGSPSYSIKKLEPLYMDADERRSGDVQNAAASIEEYARARDEHANGDRAEGQRMLDAIAEYNKYDCVSTRRLRDWLLALAADAGVPVGTDAPEREIPPLEPSPVRDALLARAGDPVAGTRTADETAAGLAAAALDYFARERKSFWQEHFTRLIQPIDQWQDTRDVMVVDRVAVVRDWYREGRQQRDRRLLELTGTLAPGSSITPSDQPGPYLLYEFPGPYPAASSDPGARSARPVRVVDVSDTGVILVEEALPKGADAHVALPSALAPAAPPQIGNQQDAIGEWASSVAAAGPGWPHDPVTDILRRQPPRTRSGALAQVAQNDGGELDYVSALTSSLLDLDHSYLAVQGPPGTGKTYVGAQVITRLVRDHAWRIGVVAQSHAVVENLLDGVVRAGLDPALVGKAQKRGDAEAPRAFTVIPADSQARFAADHADAGFVLGGTAWDFSSAARFARHSLDLLVVDEAGQFSLAVTIASSAAARSVLLLGDPQQLPQVSQGQHPEPIDESALGWVVAGNDVLPPELGYFLAQSRRMHPAVTAAVSRLSYEGRLRAHAVASERSLDGVEPGLHSVPIVHPGDSVESAVEAQAVGELVESLLGRHWADPSDPPERPLSERDIIVVSPYNAQVAAVRAELDTAGHPQVRVGTVDKFQGQEAAVSIVTLAASSPADVPRGMSFLIMKNRLNVAISRAKWAAYLLHSPGLSEYLPATPAGVAELSAFIDLTESGVGGGG